MTGVRYEKCNKQLNDVYWQNVKLLNTKISGNIVKY